MAVALIGQDETKLWWMLVVPPEYLKLRAKCGDGCREVKREKTS